jgi:hypothetical protein
VIFQNRRVPDPGGLLGEGIEGEKRKKKASPTPSFGGGFRFCWLESLSLNTGQLFAMLFKRMVYRTSVRRNDA